MTAGPAPRRILMTADAVGGVWTYALDLSRALAARGVQVMLAVLGPAPDVEQRTAASAVQGLRLLILDQPLDWLAPSPDAVAAAGRAVAGLAAREHVDLVHLNTPALAAGGAFGVPAIAMAHSCVTTWWRAVHPTEAMPPDLAWRGEMAGAGYRAAAAVIAPTAAFAQATRAAHGLARLPHVVANGRDAPAHDAVPQADRVFTAGRLWDAGKGLATLDAAAEGLPVPVLAAGPTQAPRGGTTAVSNLRLLGNLSESGIRRQLAARPIYASTACYEPFGLSVLEAAQAGCALVLSDLATFRELWWDAATFVPTGDAGATRRALLGLLQDAARRAVLGAAAQARASRLTQERMAAATLDVYRAVLRRRCEGAAA